MVAALPGRIRQMDQVRTISRFIRPYYHHANVQCPRLTLGSTLARLGRPATRPAMDPRKTTQGSGTTEANSLRLPGPTNAKHRTSVVVLRDPQALSAFVPAWAEISATAIGTNVVHAQSRT